MPGQSGVPKTTPGADQVAGPPVASRFKDRVLQQDYETALRVAPPKGGSSHAEAYRYGVERPTQPMPGWIGRLTRAHAWWRAGVDAARQAQKPQQRQQGREHAN